MEQKKDAYCLYQQLSNWVREEFSGGLQQHSVSAI